MKHLFDRLGSATCLAACKQNSTQNINESYRSVVWSLAPKESYIPTLETRLAIELVYFFKTCYSQRYMSVFKAMNNSITGNMKYLLAK